MDNTVCANIYFCKPYTAESTVINVLYNLTDDTFEMNNLLGRNPDINKYERKANELKEDLLSWLKLHKSPHYDGVKNRNLMGGSQWITILNLYGNEGIIYC